MGVKEVDKRTFIPGKTYLFFAHVAKKQPHNREMFREMAEKNISLIDYEYLTTEKGERVVAFGRHAGIVGAYNGLRARGIKPTGSNLNLHTSATISMKCGPDSGLLNLNPDLKILVTGEGRVASGAMETLSICNVVQVTPEEYLNREFDVPVVCQIGPEHYTRHKEAIRSSASVISASIPENMNLLSFHLPRLQIF